MAKDSQEEIMIRLGTTIRLLRSQKNMSLRELAEEIGVKHTFLFRLETGASKGPTLYLIHKVAEYFELTIDELMNFKAKPCPTCKGKGWVKE